jgi:peptide alpha-N-acetyltransferase
MWFLTEDGQSYARQGKLGLALKRFTSVYNVFDVWQEDQFDFHSFSLRKGQIRAYVDMMKWEDHLREHPFYSRAALSAVDIYLKIHDKPLTNGANGTEDANGDDAAERKKAAKKARKEAQKAEREALAKKNEPNKPTKEGDGEAKKKDDDPDGVKLAATSEPMVDAMKFLTPLLQFSSRCTFAEVGSNRIVILTFANPRDRKVPSRSEVPPGSCSSGQGALKGPRANLSLQTRRGQRLGGSAIEIRRDYQIRIYTSAKINTSLTSQ